MLAQLVDFFIGSAYAADTAAAPSQASSLPLLLMLAVFFLFMYFAMWRPQSKRAKEHRDLLNALGKGDEVVTAGGILGRVVKVTDTYVTMTISEATDIIVQKNSVVTVLPKGTLKSL